MSRAQRRAHLQPGGKPVEKKKEEAQQFPSPVLTGEMPPVPEVSDLDCAFQGRWRELLPSWDDMTKEERSMRGPFCEALSSLFFRGGKLADHGITAKPGVDMAKVVRYIRATLGDFGPSHEHKIGGIAHMLAKWCTIVNTDCKNQ